MALSTPSVTSPPPPEVGLEAPVVRGRILVVDDDALVARAYERILVRAGYLVTTSLDAGQAVEHFRQHGFDVVLSDVRMPGMSGLELLRAIRDVDLDVPVIIITGSPDVSGAAQALEHGAFRYLTKPVDLGELLSLVARALRLHQMARVRRDALADYGPEARFLCDRAGLETRFAAAMNQLWIAYQPIVSWSAQSLFAYEAFTRTEEPMLRDPKDLFAAAERLKCVPRLGQTIRRQVAETLAQAPRGARVFVKVHPADLLDPSLFAPEEPLSCFASQVVLEITERADLDEIADLMPRMAQLRGMGYRIALDDLGAGYSGLASFAQLEPEAAKVDKSIIHGVDRSPTRQKLLESMISLCRDLQIHLVAEGIETAEERETVVRLGGDLCQGFLFAHPGKPFPVPFFDDIRAIQATSS